MNETNGNTVSKTAVREELSRILQSPIFAQSDRLARFLRYTVEHALDHNGEALKEYVVGTNVYDRKPPYHPSQDSIVRTEARRLRAKLKEYYESQGKDDPIFINFRPGSYVPVFRSTDSNVGFRAIASSATDGFFVDGVGVSIAVVPFLDVSGQPTSSKYARAVTDELVHELIQSEGCRVIAPSIVVQLASQSSDIAAIAQKLGVQIIFEGTVREEGNFIRVTASIVNADGFQLWSQRFDAEADSSSLFTVQEQFASALVSRVRPRESVICKGEASIGAVAIGAYPAILKGEALLEEGTPSDIQAALTKFREVTQVAPEYARPYCDIAQCYSWLALHGSPHSAELAAHARSAAERAIELDSEMPEAHSAMGCVHALEWKWSPAQESFQRAVDLGSHGTVDRQHAMFLTVLGRFDEAWLYLDSAQQIDPFSNLQKIACAKFFCLSGHPDEAIEHFSEPLRYGPLPPEAQLYLALIYEKIGRHDDAKKIALQVQRIAGAQLALRAWIAEIFALCGEKSVAATIADQFGLRSSEAQLSRYRQALLAIALDDPEAATSLLTKSYEAKESELPYLSVDPRFDQLRQNSQFAKIVSRVRE